MPTVNIVTYSDSDFALSQEVAFDVGTNPLHMHVRTAAADPTVWLELTTANGIITVSDETPDDESATVDILILQSSLLNLPAGVYVQSLIMSSVNGTRRTEIWRGTFTHNVGPTRWAAGEP